MRRLADHRIGHLAWHLAWLLAVLASCDRDGETLAVSEPGQPGGSLSACVEDDDCSAGAATCCGCPEFAVHVDDPAHRACTGVSCPGQRECAANVRAACDQGFCVLACVELACPTACPAGFTIDPTGCLACTCAAPPPDGCVQDGDCVQTRADCCGCAQGGVDTAVRATEVDAFETDLACTAVPACPSVNVCDADAVPRCIQGRCELTSGELPAGACGASGLPACPPDQVCTVNASPQATLQGVGVCVPP